MVRGQSSTDGFANAACSASDNGDLAIEFSAVHCEPHMRETLTLSG
jgi:hypothetical protein